MQLVKQFAIDVVHRFAVCSDRTLIVEFKNDATTIWTKTTRHLNVGRHALRRKPNALKVGAGFGSTFVNGTAFLTLMLALGVGRLQPIFNWSHTHFEGRAAKRAVTALVHFNSL